jgi:flagellar basal body P-ring formation protein FlgA
MPSVFRHTLPALLATAFAMPAMAQIAFHDPAAIDADIAAALSAPIGQPGGAAQPVDRRLRLAQCQQPLVIQPDADAVAVRCISAGWRIRVPLAAGTASMPATMAQPARAAPSVRRGDAVTMIIRGRGFTVRMAGIADQAGSVGDTIRVRTEDRSGTGSSMRGAVVSGMIAPTGEIILPGFNNSHALP